MVPALCGQGRKTNEIKFPSLGFIAKKASTIWDSIYERASAGFSGAYTRPARRIPWTATVGIAWFARTSNVIPFGSTRWRVRCANVARAGSPERDLARAALADAGAPAEVALAAAHLALVSGEPRDRVASGLTARNDASGLCARAAMLLKGGDREEVR